MVPAVASDLRRVFCLDSSTYSGFVSGKMRRTMIYYASGGLNQNLRVV